MILKSPDVVNYDSKGATAEFSGARIIRKGCGFVHDGLL